MLTTDIEFEQAVGKPKTSLDKELSHIMKSRFPSTFTYVFIIEF